MTNFDYIKKITLDKFTVDDFLNETYRGERIGQLMCDLIRKEKGSTCKGIPCETYCSEWLHKEHKETILDAKEREYLSAVIKPFRDRVKSISKHESLEKEWVTITMEKGRLDDFDLPRFPKGTMYKGMEVDKEYTLEELGL